MRISDWSSDVCSSDLWKQTRGGREVRIDPVEQVRTTKYAIRGYVARDGRWGNRNHVAWGHGVVFPHSEFEDDFSLPELPRWALHDRTEMSTLAARLREHTWGLQQGKVDRKSTRLNSSH